MTTTYLFDKANRIKIMSMQRQAINIIKSFFSASPLAASFNSTQSFSVSKKGTVNKKQQNVLVGKPLFSITPDKVIVQIFYYMGAQKNLSDSSVTALGDALTRCFSQSVFRKTSDNRVRTVELRLIRLNHSVLDSSIFAQYLAENTKKYSFTRIFDMIKNDLPTVIPFSSLIPSTHLVGEETHHQNTDSNLEDLSGPASYITGVKVKLSGRLTTQRSGPRQTVQSGRLGSSAKGLYGIMDSSQKTSKNKLGAFTIKVWVSVLSR